MRIGINALFLIPGKVGGSEVYLRNLLRHLAVIDKKNEYILFTNKENSGTFKIDQANFREVLCPIRASFRPVRVLWEQLFLPFQVKKYRIDVLHSPGYTAPVMVPCCSVLTIHDMNCFYYPEDFPKLSALFLKMIVLLSAKRSDKIITISRNSKKDIVGMLKIPENKVCVIYEAGDGHSYPMFDQNVVREKLKGKYGINREFILTVSASHPHKNLHRLLQAYNILHKRYRVKHLLILVGIKGRAQYLLKDLIKELSLKESIIFTGWVPVEDLSILYSNADLFVFPSLFEGFGIPVLEAMAYGIPVISSNAASMPEVVGDAAILVNPYDIDEMARAMHEVLTDTNLRDKLTKKGLRRSKAFSWEETARRTLKVYEETTRIAK
ncbi:D-inositol-3-phosphate glycosyltransferase [subsurface metagenome]